MTTGNRSIRMQAIVAVSAVTLVPGASFAATAHDTPSHRALAAEIAFDIESTGLQQALDAFSAASGISILCDGALAHGRVSAALQGVMTPQVALTTLLADTGLTATFSSEYTAHILLPGAPMEGAIVPELSDTAMPLGVIHVEAPVTAPGFLRSRGLYARLMQYELQRALRRNSRLIGNRDEAHVRIWVDATGAVERSELVGTTERLPLGRAIARALEDLAVGQPPPVDFPQPVSIRVAVSEY